MATSRVYDKGTAAAAIFAERLRWSFAHRKTDGHPFFVIPGSDPGTAWYVDQRSCDCPARTFHPDAACKHMLAVSLWVAAFKRGEIVLPRRFTAADATTLTAAEEVPIAPPQTAWWEADDGRPVWLLPEDSYAPDTERDEDEEYPNLSAQLRLAREDDRRDPRDPSEPFPSWMTSAERTQAALEEMDREDAEIARAKRNAEVFERLYPRGED